MKAVFAFLVGNQYDGVFAGRLCLCRYRCLHPSKGKPSLEYKASRQSAQAIFVCACVRIEDRGSQAESRYSLGKVGDETMQCLNYRNVVKGDA